MSVIVGPATCANPPCVGMKATPVAIHVGRATSTRTPSKPRCTIAHSNSPTSRASTRWRFTASIFGTPLGASAPDV